MFNLLLLLEKNFKERYLEPTVISDLYLAFVEFNQNLTVNPVEKRACIRELLDVFELLSVCRARCNGEFFEIVANGTSWNLDCGEPVQGRRRISCFHTKLFSHSVCSCMLFDRVILAEIIFKGSLCEICRKRSIKSNFPIKLGTFPGGFKRSRFLQLQQR